MEDASVQKKLRWRSLAAAFGGWSLYAMDWMALAILMPLIKVAFNLSMSQAGLLFTATIAGAAIGGFIGGVLADYYGRVRILMFTIIFYAIFTGLCGLAQSYEQLLAFRAITGLGLGAEWGIGAALVSEYWPEARRAKATSLVHTGFPIGYGFAALLSIFIVPAFGWRGMFFVGAVPAVFALWVRWALPEPEEWKVVRDARLKAKANPDNKPKFTMAILFTPQYLRTTVFACLFMGFALMAYWGAVAWIPTFLAKERGLSLVRSGGYLVLLNAGAVAGILFFGWLADIKGRRIACIAGMGSAFFTTIIYVFIKDPIVLLIFGPVFGFTSTGCFGIFAAYLSELFPAEARASGTSLAYSGVGRIMALGAPYFLGLMADHMGLTAGLAVNAIYYLLAVGAVYCLPETAKFIKANAVPVVGK
jgi:MFS family permease